jgi:hypothetical protein
MPEMLDRCPVPTCESGPCRAALPLLIAEGAEVPVGCPNRVELSDPAIQLARWLTSTELRYTPRAAGLLSLVPAGRLREELRCGIASGRLALLEGRVRHPVHVGGRGRASPEEPPDSPVPPSPDEELDWIEIVLKKRDGSPAVGETYEINLTDGSTRRGQFDESGKVRFENIPAGTCVVGFPELDRPPESGGGADAPSGTE